MHILISIIKFKTGKHLAELCKAEYPKYAKYCLWLLAEVAVIAADIPEGWFGAQILMGFSFFNQFGLLGIYICFLVLVQ